MWAWKRVYSRPLCDAMRCHTIYYTCHWLNIFHSTSLPPPLPSSLSVCVCAAPQHCICSCIWVCDCDCIGDYLAACKTNEHSIIVFLLWLLLHLSFDLMWWNWMDCNGMEWNGPSRPSRAAMLHGMGKCNWSCSVKGCSLCVCPTWSGCSHKHNFLIACKVCINYTMIESYWGFSL